MNDDKSQSLWQTKLQARLHDPAEKALVLLRDPAGHENGTSRALWRLARHNEIESGTASAGLIENDNAEVLHAIAFDRGITESSYQTVQRADWWAAAADRMQFPLQRLSITTKTGEQRQIEVSPWARVNWAKKPLFIHPLTGAHYELDERGDLSTEEIEVFKSKSFEHFSHLLVRKDGITDFKKSVLAYWRFGPEVKEEQDNSTMGALWNLLPADTRTPDHSIWDHLDLTSAFAGAFAADCGEGSDTGASLLSLAIGPVQPFIAAARKFDDLWAGSHLLARLSWEAMKVVCERLGPDAVLFPRLRGVPLVDLWLRDDCGLDTALFSGCDWNTKGTDSNPLFSAALPNRFVAVVPSSQATEIAGEVEKRVREWLQELGEKTVTELLTEAGYAGEQELFDVPFAQMKEQLKGFPEVHWAVVPFSLANPRNKTKQNDLDVSKLSAAMAPFFNEGEQPGFLNTPAWGILQKDLVLVDENGSQTVFFMPNPGVLYPAVHELAERTLAAAKSTRAFEQLEQHGWRCTLTGESEYLTTDRSLMGKSYAHQQDSLWAAISDNKPSWAKPGERLGALSAVKRLWPTLFASEVAEKVDVGRLERFVVSTHTMALANQLYRWAGKGESLSEDLMAQIDRQSPRRVALPAKLAKALYKHNQAEQLAKLPSLLDEADDERDPVALARSRAALEAMFGEGIETYYGLLLLDGDNMGAWLSGADGHAITYRQSMHPHILNGFDKHAEKHPLIKRYGDQKRALSPNRHLAISGALNDFSLTVARHVVEEEHLGRLIYAGGDDVFAMLPVVDLLPAMERLRDAYSGDTNKESAGYSHSGLSLASGFAMLSQGGNRKLMRMMGSKATASCGAVIAHHQAPLTMVRRELEIAERRAKNEGGRNAFSLTVIKRSGSVLTMQAKWGEPLQLLCDVRDFLASQGVSRRAVFNTLQWLDEKRLPSIESNTDLLTGLLSQQFKRQVEESVSDSLPVALKPDALALRLTQVSLQSTVEAKQQTSAISWLRNFLSVAEFLARETRTGAEI